MAESTGELRRIHWAACFPFTQVFRMFRLAVQPSKLGLALAAVVLTGLWGRVLDGVWTEGSKPLAHEVVASWQVRDLDGWRSETRSSQVSQLRAACQMVDVPAPEKLSEALADRPGKVIADLLDKIDEAHEKAHEAALSRLEEQKVEKNGETWLAELSRIGQVHDSARRVVEEVRPVGVYRSLADYQTRVASQLVSAATALNFAGGLAEVLDGADAGGRMAVRMVPADAGVLSCAVLAVRGLHWMVCAHPWYSVLFWVPVLAIWALFGGALCRSSALSVARDERIAPAAAVAFARQKFVGFFGAPLFPLLMIVLIGVALVVGGFVSTLPYLGDLISWVGIPLVLLAAFVLAAAILGGLAGVSLMWPTIAAEGSDAFDAMSRSYGYVFAKPWRAGFYGAVAVVYGSIIYLFVHLFVWLGLRAARLFLAMGMFHTERPGTGSVDATKIDAIWPMPGFAELMPERSAYGAHGLEGATGWLMGLALLLVVSAMYALAASLYFNGSTIIYFLLRREVDATDFEDIYLDTEDEDGEPLPPLTPATPEPVHAASTTPPAAPPPLSPAPPASPDSPAPSAPPVDPSGPTSTASP